MKLSCHSISALPVPPTFALRGIEADFGQEHVDTALRSSAFLQTGGKLQVMAERRDNYRKDDDVRWQKSEKHI